MICYNFLLFSINLVQDLGYIGFRFRLHDLLGVFVFFSWISFKILNFAFSVNFFPLHLSLILSLQVDEKTLHGLLLLDEDCFLLSILLFDN